MSQKEKSNQQKLKQIVIQKSKAETWGEAKKEWDLLTIFDRLGNCVCNHVIVENCVIKNRKTKNILIVGNVCINHFQQADLTVPKVCRSSLRNLHKDPINGKANDKLLDLAQALRILTEKEATTYKNYKKSTRELSQKIRLKCNHLIFYGFAQDRPKCYCENYAKPRRNFDGKYFYSCSDGKYVDRQWQAPCNFSQDVSQPTN